MVNIFLSSSLSYNELADKEANKAAEGLSMTSEIDSRCISINLNIVKKTISRMQIKSRQKLQIGERAREIILSVRNKLYWLEIQPVDMAHAQMNACTG